MKLKKKTKLFNRLKEDLKKVELEGEEIRKEYEIYSKSNRIP